MKYLWMWLVHARQSPEFHLAVVEIFNGLKSGANFHDIEVAVQRVAPVLCANTDWKALRLCLVSVAKCGDMVEGGDLHSVRSLIPILLAFGCPMPVPFQFRSFVEMVANMLDIQGLPSDMVYVRDAFVAHSKN